MPETILFDLKNEKNYNAHFLPIWKNVLDSKICALRFEYKKTMLETLVQFPLDYEGRTVLYLSFGML